MGNFREVLEGIIGKISSKIGAPLNTFKCLLQAENSMTGRTYMGEILVLV